MKKTVNKVLHHHQSKQKQNWPLMEAVFLGYKRNHTDWTIKRGICNNRKQLKS